VRSAVLEAVFDLLAEVGYERMTIEEVAARAGVHKTTVYRRWSSKPELVLDATRAFSEETIPIPDTGTLEGDLRMLGRGVVATIGADPGARRSMSIIAAAAATGELMDAMHAFWEGRLALTAPIVKRAIDRGDVPPGTEPNLVIESLIGPLWIRLLMTGEPIDSGFSDRLATAVAAGFRPGS